MKRISALIKKLKFDQRGLVPAIIQDAKTGQVLMMAYMDRQALRKTLRYGKTHFWSRSRGKLWMKGESSGHLQKVRQVFLDCDGDTLLIKVAQTDAACHTGYYSCFYRKINLKSAGLKVTAKKIFEPKRVYRK
jgi:phosphoribosyl-AMP cyclohydrolase